MSVPADARIARRAAAELSSGMTVNLGIGLPQRVPAYLAPGIEVCIQAENGIAGVGRVLADHEADRNLIDAGGMYISTVPGTSFFDSATSFAMIRGGRIDLAVLGALEVAANGDLANWTVPGKFTPGVGGGMELAQKARRVLVLTFHRDKAGRPKIVQRCSLPLTASRCVDRIISDLAVIDVVEQRLVLREVAEGVTPDMVREATGAPIDIPNLSLPTF